MKIGALFLLSCLPVALTAPTYQPLPGKPDAGVSGVHHDKETNIVHAYYGEKDLPKHREHLILNHVAHPQNNRPFNLGQPGSNKNRQAVINRVPPRRGSRRDEKPPNFVAHDGKESVTLRYVPKDESGKRVFFYRIQFHLF